MIIITHSHRCFSFISETVEPLFTPKESHHFTNTSVPILHFQLIAWKKGKRAERGEAAPTANVITFYKTLFQI